MSILSKTGLIATEKKQILDYSIGYSGERKKIFEHYVLSSNIIVKPIEFSIRPFGGLYNPYSKGCSVLCNHPASRAIRDVIKNAKDSWSSEGKTLYGSHQKDNANFESTKFDTSGHIPDDLFRRYTDTDSRPLTPTPTTTSIRTKTSGGGSFLNTRRCVTPEPAKDTINKRKKIILDLRRSHSQETVYWKASSEISQGGGGPIGTPINLLYDDKVEILETSKIDEESAKKVIKTTVEEEQQISGENKQQQQQQQQQQQTCINERDVDEGGESYQRRGKKRKKIKQRPATIFHLSQDPETQISALGPDSINASTRPSLVPNQSLVPILDSKKNEDAHKLLRDSFLSDEAFRVLKTELDIDVIENTFERYLNRALREAIKYITPKKINIPDKYKKNPLKDLYYETKKDMPRKLSKSAARFSIPLNLKLLETITVFEYLSQHVWISRERKQFYKKIFLKFICKDDLDESGEPLKNIERRILSINFRNALYEVLGFYADDKIIDNVYNLAEIDNYSEIYFRSWCGIVAFSERFTIKDPENSDSCDELEKADFDSLEERLDLLNLSSNMKIVLETIRKGHMGARLI